LIMEPLFVELNVEIFKYISTPINILVTNRKWYNISQDPHARAEWLIFKYGRAHALFHAIRLGNGFITIEVIQALLSKNAILSRYLVQRLLMHFGNYDENLIKLKVEHNVSQVDFNRLRALKKNLSSPWGNNIPLSSFVKLITEGYIIVARLKHLIDLGFQLTDSVIEEAFHLFEHKLNEIGDLLMNSFQVIRKESESDLASSCLIHAIKPERNLKKTVLLEFLISKIDQPSEALKNALDHYNVGFKFNDKTIRTTKEIRSLSVQSNFYYWILKNCDPNSEITRKCFDDIFESRIWIDLKVQETPERNAPKHLTSSSFNSICFIYLEFCNGKVPFNQN
ncbi:7893_t:CDS:2, partial [Funneliformis geosporum]